MFGLEYLISPVAVDEFRTQSWGERACYIPGLESKFADLFGWDDINHIMNSSRSWEGVRLVYETRNLPHEALGRLDAWLAKGATLVINSVNQLDPIVGRFATSLGHELNTHVNINSYTSCPAKQGFDNHFDRHDVFIVQIAGTKVVDRLRADAPVAARAGEGTEGSPARGRALSAVRPHAR